MYIHQCKDTVAQGRVNRGSHCYLTNSWKPPSCCFLWIRSNAASVSKGLWQGHIPWCWILLRFWSVWWFWGSVCRPPGLRALHFLWWRGGRIRLPALDPQVLGALTGGVLQPYHVGAIPLTCIIHLLLQELTPLLWTTDRRRKHEKYSQ